MPRPDRSWRPASPTSSLPRCLTGVPASGDGDFLMKVKRGDYDDGGIQCRFPLCLSQLPSTWISPRPLPLFRSPSGPPETHTRLRPALRPSAPRVRSQTMSAGSSGGCASTRDQASVCLFRVVLLGETDTPRFAILPFSIGTGACQAAPQPSDSPHPYVRASDQHCHPFRPLCLCRHSSVSKAPSGPRSLAFGGRHQRFPPAL